MKKFIAIFCILMLSFLYTSGQSSVKIGTKKDTLTVNFIAEDKKQSVETNNVNTQLAKSVDSQLSVNSELKETIGLFNLTAESVLRIVEEHNKTDGVNFLSNFNFTHEKVTKILNKQKWLVFSTIIILLIYVLSIIIDRSFRSNTSTGVISKVLFYGIYCLFIYFVSIKLLTILLNGDYYVIKELMKLYS